MRAKRGCVCVHRHTGLSIFPLFRFAAVHNRCEITGKISYEHTYFLKFYLYGTLKLEIYEGMKNRHLFWTGEVTLRAKGKFHALTCRTRWKDAQRTRHQCVNMKDKNECPLLWNNRILLRDRAPEWFFANLFPFISQIIYYYSQAFKNYVIVKI